MPSIINASTTLGLISTADTSGVLQLQTANTTALTINASQNVGVGTASPANKLHVNGTGDSGRFQGTSRSLYIATDTNASAIWNGAGQTGEGVYLNAASNQLDLYTNSTVKVRIDASGNLGLGVTPSASTLSGIIEGGYGTFGLTSSIGVALAGNAYYNSGWKYKASSTATLQLQDSGGFKWNVAASGTAGNAISFTQAMTLDASGNLAVGATSPTQSWTGGSARVAQLQGGSSQITVLRVNESSATYGDLQLVSAASAEVGIYNFANGAMRFGTNGTERARITSDGSLVLNNAAGDANMYFGGSSGTNRMYLARSGVNSLLVNVETSGALIFGTNGAERARIDAAGEFLIGTTSSGASQRLAIVGGATLCMMKNTSATDGTARTTILFRDNGDNTRGTITVSTSGTVYNTTSDYRLKENIAPMTGALAKVAQLNPVTYKWKETGDSGQGFIAHELAEVVPECVTGEKDAVEQRNGQEFIVPQGIDTSFLVATLTAAIQEQQALITQLQADVATLKGN